MKSTIYILFILLFYNVCKAQKNHFKKHTANHDSLLLGSWKLIKTTFINDITNCSDTATNYLENFYNQKISFTKNTLYKHINFGTEDTFKLPFRYVVSFNEKFSYKELTLYLGKGKRKQETRYQLITCTPNLLVLKSTELLTKGIDNVVISVYYYYQKEDASEWINKLLGTWYNYHNEKNNFSIYSYTGTSEFTKTLDTSNFKNTENKNRIHFTISNAKQMIQIWQSTEPKNAFHKEFFF